MDSDAPSDRADSRSEPSGRAPRTALLLLVILALGAGLRFTGMRWGLPDENHLVSYRSDEWRAVEMGMDLELVKGEVAPMYTGKPYFNWGSLHFYFMSVACSVANEVGWIDSEGGLRTWSVETFARAHLIGRGISALHGLAAIGLLYLLASHWFGRRAGLLAALLQAIGPLDVLEGHCALVNVTVAFWSMLAVGSIARALELGRTRAFVLAGAATGLAISSKLAALPLLPVLGGAVLWTGLARTAAAGSLKLISTEHLKRQVGLLCASFGSVLVAFALFSPAVVLNPQEFARQAYQQLVVTPSAGIGLTFAGTGNGFAFLFLNNLPVVLGWPLWGAAMCGLLWAAPRALRALRAGGWRSPSPELAADAVCLAWLFVQLVPLGMSQTRFLRYLLPVTPFLYLFAARFVSQLDAGLPRRASIVLRSAALVGLLYTGLYSAAQVQSMRRVDPRDQAVAWFEENVTPNALVGLLAFPSHLVPAVHPFTGPLNGRVSAKRAALGVGPKNLRWTILQLDPDKLAAERPDYLVYNPVEFAPYLRVGVESALRFSEILERDYQDAGGPWSSELRLFGIPFDGGGEETRGWAPASTKVRILERRDRLAPSDG